MLIRSCGFNKNADPNKYGYSGYDLDSIHVPNFHGHTVAGVKVLLFSELTVVLLCMLIIKKDILVLGQGPTQGLDDTTITAEDKYHINFTE